VRIVKPGRTEHALRVLADLDRMLKSSKLGDRKQIGLRYTEQAVLAIVRGRELHVQAQPTAQQSL
jgi:hypothetical protein